MAPIFTGSKLGFGRVDAAGASGPSAFASGGTITTAGITPGNGYRYHVFTSPGTFQVLSSSLTSVEYLVVAGGGGGGAALGGGGGAGGFRTNVPGHPLAGSPFPVSVSSYPVTVGPGGPGGSNSGSPSYLGTVGGTSSFGPISAGGGGGGGSFPDPFTGGPPNPALQGGSGGGGGRGSSPYVGTTGGGPGNYPPVSPSQGNGGGTGGANTQGPVGQPNHSYGGGGGGGAGGSGGNATIPGGAPDCIGGSGGSGSPIPAFAAPLISSEIPAPVQPTWIPVVGPTGLYAGGGGGAAAKQAGNPGVPGPGGSGGGGAGSTPNGPVTTAQSGVSFTGGGGGGDGGPGSTPGGAGGTGIVIIRYLV